MSFNNKVKKNILDNGLHFWNKREYFPFSFYEAIIWFLSKGLTF